LKSIILISNRGISTSSTQVLRCFN